eukprot:NODE_5408_length_680_cov_23.022187_g5034_i0.p2 GENE.NODE_5408_length_680_cov_23.022187_g5034_i0~~NODE_5408_length_680_cov_23.022187_g5034_i0.p2  ORF type:complete len:123 (+),score=4.31 NODE_5408_length_680_cov_23.022187_g5034_i0:163-531(+)
MANDSPSSTDSSGFGQMARYVVVACALTGITTYPLIYHVMPRLYRRPDVPRAYVAAIVASLGSGIGLFLYEKGTKAKRLRLGVPDTPDSLLYSPEQAPVPRHETMPQLIRRLWYGSAQSDAT